MKKFLFTILLTFCATINIHAITVDVEGIRYEIISTEDLTARVKGFADTEFSDVVIPEYIEYYGKQFKVIEIGEAAFDSEKVFTHISLPSTLQIIGERAFFRSGLLELDIPNSVTKIGNRIVCSCPNLEKVVIGRSIQTIPYWSLYNLPKCEYIFVPSSVLDIEYGGIATLDIQSLIIEDSAKKINSTYPKDPKVGNSVYDASWLKSTGSTGTVGLKSGNNGLFPCCKIQNLYLGRNLAQSSISFNYLPHVENLTVGSYVTDIKGQFNLNYMQKIKLMTSTPPAFERGDATEECYMRVKVYVPKGSLKTYKNHAEWGKYWNIEEYDESCAAPEISYSDGMLKVTPVTQGSICYYTITDDDIVTDKEMNGGINLTGTYNIEAYAILNGSKSERSFAKLCWFDNTLTGTGFIQPLGEPKRPVIIKSNNGQVVVEGLEDDETVDLYTIDGKHVGNASAIGNRATFDTMQGYGQTLILRAGENSVKFILR